MQNFHKKKTKQKKAGDLNMPDTNWSSFSASSSSSSCLADQICAKNFIQLITQPTHHCGNILDLVLSNSPSRISNVSVDSTICASQSDHHLISYCIHSSSRNRHSRQSPVNPFSALNYSKANLTELNRHFANSDLYDSVFITDLNSYWYDLKLEITNACLRHVPKFNYSQRKYPRYFTPCIRHKLNCIRTLRRRIRKTATSHSISQLETMELELLTLIQTARANYEAHLTATFSRDPKKLFGHLKNLNKCNNSLPNFIIHQSSPVYDPIIKANLFNRFFNSTFSSSTYVLPPVECLPTPTSQLSHIDITPIDVYNALSSIDPTKAIGCDNIHPYILKHCATTLCTPITNLFQACIQNQSLPTEWKVHKIRPIFKKENPLHVENYRPISLLCILSKVLEKIIYVKIIPFIRPRLSKHQFGFLRNRSCLTQLLVSFNEIFTSIEEGQAVDTIYFDFKKAFDSIPHAELLYKLWTIGITGPLWFWFKSYLTNRQHYVNIDEHSSQSLPVLSGVPQGSIVGPLLFLAYINDLPNNIDYASIYLFADDTKFIKSILANLASTSDPLLQSDIDLLVAWCKVWKLSLNAVKCAAIRFSLSPKTPLPSVYKVDETMIPFLPCHRDLGIVASNDLSWSNHYDLICSKAYRTLHLIRRSISSSSSVATRKQLYLSLVKSKLSYCSQLWRPRLIKDIRNFERIQHRATKFIFAGLLT